MQFSDHALSLLKSYYLLSYETEIDQAFERASKAYCADDYALADRIYNYVRQGWFMFSSPSYPMQGSRMRKS